MVNDRDKQQAFEAVKETPYLKLLGIELLEIDREKAVVQLNAVNTVATARAFARRRNRFFGCYDDGFCGRRAVNKKAKKLRRLI